MSWKGVTKAISRFPHQISSNSKKEATKDGVYDTLESQFQAKVKDVEQLVTSITTFRDQTCSLLDYQRVPSWLAIIEPDISTDVPEETSRVYQDFAMAMEYCSEEVRQSLDHLDSAVLQPLTTYLAMTKSIQKSITKRLHKQIDYDRFRISHQKLCNMADKSPSEEKNVFKLEAQLETASKDYFYVNDLLKSELQQFLLLTQKLVTPLFETVYNMQCKIYGGIYARIYEIATSHSGSITMDLSIEQGYQAQRARRNIDQEMSQLEVLQKENVYLHSSGTLSLQERASCTGYSPKSPAPTVAGTMSSISRFPQTTSLLPTQLQQQQHKQQNPSFQMHQNLQQNQQIPSMIPQQQHRVVSASAHQPKRQQVPSSTMPVTVTPTITQALRRPPPPPPKPKSFTKRIEYATALYDFDAQEDQDLTLRQGDKIEIIEKTNGTDDWWKGRIGEQVGIFPANYVQLL